MWVVQRRLTVCVSGLWAGVDSAWEQKKLEARKMLENAAESPPSTARCVGQEFEDSTTILVTHHNRLDAPRVGR